MPAYNVVDWDALERQIAPLRVTNADAALETFLFDAKQRLRSTDYATVLITYTMLHTLSINVGSHLRRAFQDEVLLDRLLQLQRAKSNTLAAALAQLLCDWQHMFKDEPFVQFLAPVAQAVRPRAIPGMRPTPVAMQYTADRPPDLSGRFRRGFDFTLFLPKRAAAAPPPRDNYEPFPRTESSASPPAPPTPDGILPILARLSARPGSIDGSCLPGSPFNGQMNHSTGATSMNHGTGAGMPTGSVVRSPMVDIVSEGSGLSRSGNMFEYEYVAHWLKSLAPEELVRLLCMRTESLSAQVSTLSSYRGQETTVPREVIEKGDREGHLCNILITHCKEVLSQTRLVHLDEATRACADVVRQWKRLYLLCTPPAETHKPPSDKELLGRLPETRSAFPQSACLPPMTSCQHWEQQHAFQRMTRQPAIQMSDPGYVSTLVKSVMMATTKVPAI